MAAACLDVTRPQHHALTDPRDIRNEAMYLGQIPN